MDLSQKEYDADIASLREQGAPESVIQEYQAQNRPIVEDKKSPGLLDKAKESIVKALEGSAAGKVVGLASGLAETGKAALEDPKKYAKENTKDLATALQYGAPTALDFAGSALGGAAGLATGGPGGAVVGADLGGALGSGLGQGIADVGTNALGETNYSAKDIGKRIGVQAGVALTINKAVSGILKYGSDKMASRLNSIDAVGSVIQDVKTQAIQKADAIASSLKDNLSKVADDLSAPVRVAKETLSKGYTEFLKEHGDKVVDLTEIASNGLKNIANLETNSALSTPQKLNLLKKTLNEIAPSDGTVSSFLNADEAYTKAQLVASNTEAYLKNKLYSFDEAGQELLRKTLGSPNDAKNFISEAKKAATQKASTDLSSVGESNSIDPITISDAHALKQDLTQKGFALTKSVLPSDKAKGQMMLQLAGETGLVISNATKQPGIKGPEGDLYSQLSNQWYDAKRLESLAIKAFGKENPTGKTVDFAAQGQRDKAMAYVRKAMDKGEDVSKDLILNANASARAYNDQLTFLRSLDAPEAQALATRLDNGFNQVIAEGIDKKKIEDGIKVLDLMSGLDLSKIHPKSILDLEKASKSFNIYSSNYKKEADAIYNDVQSVYNSGVIKNDGKSMSAFAQGMALNRAGNLLGLSTNPAYQALANLSVLATLTKNYGLIDKFTKMAKKVATTATGAPAVNGAMKTLKNVLIHQFLPEGDNLGYQEEPPTEQSPTNNSY